MLEQRDIKQLLAWFFLMRFSLLRARPLSIRQASQFTNIGESKALSFTFTHADQSKAQR